MAARGTSDPVEVQDSLDRSRADLVPPASLAGTSAVAKGRGLVAFKELEDREVAMTGTCCV